MLIKEGSFDGESFVAFLQGLLDMMEPYPVHNSVLVMHNCTIHKVDRVRELVESRSVSFSLALSPTDISGLGAASCTTFHHIHLTST